MSSPFLVGGGSGYGAGIAKLFAEQGAKVVVADINEDGGKRTTQTVPRSMKFYNMNVAKARDWQLLVEITQDAFGGVDCLVNNAGTTYRNKVSLCHISVNVLHADTYFSQLLRSPNPISIDALT